MERILKEMRLVAEDWHSLSSSKETFHSIASKITESTYSPTYK